MWHRLREHPLSVPRPGPSSPAGHIPPYSSRPNDCSCGRERPFRGHTRQAPAPKPLPIEKSSMTFCIVLNKMPQNGIGTWPASLAWIHDCLEILALRGSDPQPYPYLPQPTSAPPHGSPMWPPVPSQSSSLGRKRGSYSIGQTNARAQRPGPGQSGASYARSSVPHARLLLLW
jgi:hypothetical protein